MLPPLFVVRMFSPASTNWRRSGCASIPTEFSALLDTSGLPDVIGPFGRTPITDVEAPDASVLASPLAAQLRPSVLRINGVAPSCQHALEGSGFVVAPERVMTNAHVVAGTESITVDTMEGALPAQVVLFDSAVDIAVLAVPGLDAPVLPFAPEQAQTGDNASCSVTPAAVRTRPAQPAFVRS